MNSPNERTTDHRYCGRDFTAKEIDRIRELITADPPLNRAQLSRRVCDELHWLRPDGTRKDMSCRVAMLRMERNGLIRLPPPLYRTATGGFDRNARLPAIRANPSNFHGPRWAKSRSVLFAHARTRRCGTN
jgi:hypothetical protein